MFSTRMKKATSILLSAAVLAGAMAIPACAAQAKTTIPDSSTTLTFSENGVTASGTGTGYKISGSDLTINAAGTYTITGSSSEGSITVKKGTTGVNLILDDLTLSSSSAAPLSVNKTSEATVYVVGSVSLTDNEDPANEESTDTAVADAFEGAAIKVKSDASLTITGTGTLNVDGSSCKNGIKGAATSELVFDGSVTTNVKAANNGIADDNSVVINGGTLNITAGNDGIKAEPDADDTESAGTITINNGSVTIDAQGDGIQATGELVINNGSFDIKTFGGSSNAKNLTDDDSAKGIKSDSSVNIKTGSFKLNTADDAIHSNGNITIDGGTYNVASGDDAIHSDYDLTINNGNFTIASCVEGFEGATVTLNNGTGSIVASDDGVNAATDASVSDIHITINDGDWTIDSNGDGLDAGGNSTNNSGGSVNINGGKTIVYGAANGGNAGIDADSGLNHKGGTLLIVDYSGMNQMPSNGTYVSFGSAGQMGGRFGRMNSTQNAAGGNISISKGSSIAVKDSSGNTIISATGTKNANCVTLCDDSLVSGQTYTLYINGSAVATATATTGNGNTMGGMPGGMQPGGMPQNGNMNQGGMMPGQRPGSNQQNGTTNQDSTSNQQSNSSSQDGTTTQTQPSTGNQQPTMPNHQNGMPGQPPMQNGNMGQPPQMNGTQPPEMNGTMPPEMNGTMPNQQENAAGQQNNTSSQNSRTQFKDVNKNAFYSDAVDWAVGKNVTKGTAADTFSPNANCNRAQVITFLWRAAGSPTPTATENPFTDVPDNAYYSDAVLWAIENGITTGTSANKFSPNQTCTRGQVVTFLNRLANEKSSTNTNPFTDVANNSYYHDAVVWAAEKDVTQGMTATTFGPDRNCTRGEVVTFLYRAMK